MSTIPFPRLMVMGHARHGKDTVSDIICRRYGCNFVSSSMFVAEKAVRPALASAGITYETLDECYADRVNHRQAWFDAISNYNKPDGGRMGRELFSEYAIYCGIRNSFEFQALKNTGVIQIAVWVDASNRVDPEPATSISVHPWMADFVIDNNGDLKQLNFNVNQFCDYQIDRNWFGRVAKAA